MLTSIITPASMRLKGKIPEIAAYALRALRIGSKNSRD